MSLLVFPAKDPNEVVVLSINFIDLLAPSETIASASWMVEQADGTVVTGLLQGLTDYSQAPIVMQTVKGGTHGVSYLHRAQVVTSAGRTLVGGGMQRVVKGA